MPLAALSHHKHSLFWPKAQGKVIHSGPWPNMAKIPSRLDHTICMLCTVLNCSVCTVEMWVLLFLTQLAQYVSEESNALWPMVNWVKGCVVCPACLCVGAWNVRSGLSCFLALYRVAEHDTCSPLSSLWNLLCLPPSQTGHYSWNRWVISALGRLVF